jgi:histidine triad (HIT) family protein
LKEHCAFCKIANDEADAMVVLHTEHCLAFLDTRPLFHGHCLIIPRRHFETLAELPLEDVEPLFVATRLLTAAVPVAMGAEGTFVAINNRVSQSVPHLHVHVVPRRRQDGLKGFFWPRTAYRDESQSAAVRDAIKSAVASMQSSGHPGQVLHE